MLHQRDEATPDIPRIIFVHTLAPELQISGHQLIVVIPYTRPSIFLLIVVIPQVRPPPHP